jgi:hypothetical protein
MTSYERVYRLLCDTPTGKDVWDRAVKALASMKVDRVEWRLKKTDDTATAVPVFCLSNGSSWDGDSLNVAELRPRDFLTMDAAREIIEKHFGPDKDVKTFNCKTSIVKAGGTVNRKNRWGEREQHYQEDFHDFILRRFTEETGATFRDAGKRLRQECEDMKTTQEFRQSQREALIGFCKDTLTKALLPWHEMEQSVLEEAWDQFICTAIMRN